jgi:hypothetical protein
MVPNHPYFNCVITLNNIQRDNMTKRSKHKCSFAEDSTKDVAGWMATNLKTNFCSASETVWWKKVEAEWMVSKYVGV